MFYKKSLCLSIYNTNFSFNSVSSCFFVHVSKMYLFLSVNGFKVNPTAFINRTNLFLKNCLRVVSEETCLKQSLFLHTIPFGDYTLQLSSSLLK